MARRSLLKRAATFLLTLCLLATTLLGIIPAAVLAETAGTNIYFLNSNGWESVGAYVYGDKGELLGSWGTTTATSATELGEKWVKVTASDTPPCNIIFYNKADDSQRAELYIDAADKLYVSTAGAYTTQADAEASVAPATTVYFLNSNDWGTVGAHAYIGDTSLTGDWGTTTAAASSLGGKWVEVTVPSALPFNIILFNKDADGERTTVYLSDASGVYVTVGDKAYLTQEAAENAIMPKTTVYFLNSNDWATVGAHAYVGETSLTGDWGTTTAAASSLGGKWVEVTVSSELPFDIIFFNTADDTQRATVALSETTGTYVTVNSVAFTTQAAAEASVAPAGTNIYFLNSNGWESVGAYSYYTNDNNETVEPLGGWGAATVEAAFELGEKWVKVTASEEPPYNVIFYNKADDTQRAELYIDAAEKVYVSLVGAYATQAEAEASVAPAEPTTKVYFLNSNDWATVGAHAYVGDNSLTGDWGTTTASASSLGGKWVEVTVSSALPFDIIFYNTADDTQRATVALSETSGTYVTVNSAAFTTQADAEASVAPSEPEGTNIYFLNSDEWASVGAYIYGDKGELLGSWGTTTANADSGNWVKVSVPDVPPYNIIFFNTADPDNQRAELYLGDASNVYVTVNAVAFASKEAAEASVAPAEPEGTDIYFLNSDEWASVGAYIYGDQGELLGAWGSTTATAASELGEKWMKVNVSEAPPYSIIFYNKADETQRVELALDAADKVYVSLKGAYTTQADAEASVAPTEPAETYDLYFLNSNEWASVGAYIYGDQGELLGGWGSATATADSGKWVKVAVPGQPPYNVIFYNKADETQRAELLVDAADKIYVTVKSQAFTSKEAAEASINPVETYDLYFLNSNGWASVGAYIYGEKGELMGAWGSTTATADSGKWVKVAVPGQPPYNVIFYNKADETQRAELLIDAADKIYVTVKSQAFTTRKAAEASMAPVETKDLYFLNSEGWETVGAYIYGDKGELLGAWGSTTATPAEDLGGDWMKVSVPGEPPYSVIFYNTADETQRAELFIDAADKIYVNARGLAFNTKEAAEKMKDKPEGDYTIYFLNYNGWTDVGAYIYGEQGELLGSWGSATAEAAPELGENWMKVAVTALPPYSIIFYNKADETQRAELFIDAAEKIYVTSDAEAYMTQAEAEAAMGVTISIDPNNRKYGANVEVIDVMEGKGTQSDNGISWILPVGGAAVVVLAGVAWLLLKKKKSA